MPKQWYNIYMKTVVNNPALTTKLGEVTHIRKIKSEGLAYQTCKTIQETVGENFKVYYE